MNRIALLFALSALLPLGACGVAPLDGETGSDGETGTTSQPLLDPVALPDFWEQPPTVIDFDYDPVQAAILDGTIVDSTYASWGVTFTCVACSSGHAYARSQGRTGNGVSLVPSPFASGFDSRFGAVRADFTSPRSFVSIDALGTPVTEPLNQVQVRPWLEAYDATNTLISRVYYPAYGTPGFRQWQTLRIDAPAANIKYVLFSSQYFAGYPAVLGAFDNVTFNTDPIYRLTVVRPKPVKSLPSINPRGAFLGP